MGQGSRGSWVRVQGKNLASVGGAVAHLVLHENARNVEQLWVNVEQLG